MLHLLQTPQNKSVFVMTDETKNELIRNMTENIVVLRTKLNITQSELASRIGVSRHTLMAIENKQRIMTWGLFCLCFCFS